MRQPSRSTALSRLIRFTLIWLPSSVLCELLKCWNRVSFPLHGSGREKIQAHMRGVMYSLPGGAGWLYTSPCPWVPSPCWSQSWRAVLQALNHFHLVPSTNVCHPCLLCFLPSLCASFTCFSFLLHMFCTLERKKSTLVSEPLLWRRSCVGRCCRIFLSQPAPLSDCCRTDEAVLAELVKPGSGRGHLWIMMLICEYKRPETGTYCQHVKVSHC